MDKTFQYQIWNEFNDKAPLQFLEGVLISLNDEIDLCLKHFNFSNRIQYAEQNQQLLFWLCTEMSWMSLLNNAMIRRFGAKVCSLREISLHHNEKGYVGRPDLLVSFNTEDKNYQILFEGKMDEWNGKWKPKDEEKAMKDYYDSIHSQSNKYIDILTNEVINNYDPLVVTIGFDWMRSSTAIDSAKSYFSRSKVEMQTDFCALYTRGNSGMWTYGKIFGLGL